MLDNCRHLNQNQKNANTEKPSVLLVDLARSFGGAEVRVIETAKHLDMHCHCGVAVLEMSPLHKKLKNEQLPVFPIPYKRADPRIALALTSIIKQHQYAIVDTHNPQSHLWGMAATQMSKSAAHMVTVHSSRDNTVPWYKTQLYDRVLRTCARKGADFIAVSNSVVDYLDELGVPSSQISMIWNGLKAPKSEELAEQAWSLREEYGWSKDDFVIISVGRLEPIKGHYHLIAALAEMVREFPDVRCLIVGEGRSRSLLEKQRDRLGLNKVLCFTGYRDDVSDLLPQCDVFCMPSLSEGLPFALLEACLQKIPVLCTDVGGMGELLEHTVSGLLVTPESSSSLAKGIRLLRKKPEIGGIMTSNAYDMVRDRFNLDEMLLKTEALFRTVIARITVKKNTQNNVVG